MSDVIENPTREQVTLQSALASIATLQAEVEGLKRATARQVRSWETCHKNNDQLREMMARANEILRSALVITRREEKRADAVWTNWSAFKARLLPVLDEQHRAMYPEKYEPAQPTKAETRPAITKVGRCWPNADGTWSTNNEWEFADGYGHLAATMQMSTTYNGWPYAELAQQSVLWNPMPGDQFRLDGRNRTIIGRVTTGGITTGVQILSDFASAPDFMTLESLADLDTTHMSDFHPIPDAPATAQPTPPKPSEQAAQASVGIADKDGVTPNEDEVDKGVFSYQTMRMALRLKDKYHAERDAALAKVKELESSLAAMTKAHNDCLDQLHRAEDAAKDPDDPYSEVGLFDCVGTFYAMIGGQKVQCWDDENWFPSSSGHNISTVDEYSKRYPREHHLTPAERAAWFAAHPGAWEKLMALKGGGT